MTPQREIEADPVLVVIEDLIEDVAFQTRTAGRTPPAVAVSPDLKAEMDRFYGMDVQSVALIPIVIDIRLEGTSFAVCL